MLARHFASRMAFEMGREGVVEFSDEAMVALEAYDWPGNVRELKNVVERAVYLADSLVIQRIEFDPFREPFEKREVPDESRFEQSQTDKPPDRAIQKKQLFEKSFEEAVEEFEIQLIRDALERSRYNQKETARRLELTYDQFRGLYRKYKRHL
jgi:psp operon transcriptional activator